MAGRRGERRSGGPRRTSVWLQPEQAPRGDSTLSRERIVEAAITLLDAEGIEALTMRRLADRVGSGVMSLYWHVDNKEDVFELALDSVLAYRELTRKASASNWRDEVVHLLGDWRACLLTHPWAALLMPSRVLGPNSLGRLEALARILSGAGVPDSELNVAIWSLWNYVMGATVTRANFDRSEEDRRAAQQHLARLGEHYPTIAASCLLMDSDWDGTFRKGLDRLLDGLAPEPRRRRAAPVAAPQEGETRKAMP